MKVLKQYSEDLSNKVAGFESLPMELNVGDISGYGLTLNIDVNTPAASVFTTDGLTNLCVDVAHGLTTGLKGQVTTTGVLPTGISAVTDYYIIAGSTDTYYLATSLVNALAGTYITISDAGTGNHTFTPTALAGGSYQLKVSIDGLNYVPLAAATNITADAEVFADEVDPLYNWVKVVYTLTAGRMSVVQRVIVKGE